jgi:hypothetical protein
MTVGYTAPDATIERERFATAGGAATTTYAKFRSFSAAKLLRVKAWVATAGTVAGHGFDVYIGTTSVATLPLGTGAAGVSASANVNLPVAAGDQISVRSLADATGVADILFEYRNAE